jgi:hypothetical protein
MREQPLHAGERQKGGQKLGCDVAFEQPVAVLGEGRRIPDRIVDAYGLLALDPVESGSEVEDAHEG